MLSNLSSMDNIYVKSLERRDAQTVFDYWPYNSSTNVENVADEIDSTPIGRRLFKIDQSPRLLNELSSTKRTYRTFGWMRTDYTP